MSVTQMGQSVNGLNVTMSKRDAVKLVPPQTHFDLLRGNPVSTKGGGTLQKTGTRKQGAATVPVFSLTASLRKADQVLALARRVVTSLK